MSSKRARAIAFYLPQYHPIPENDTWWGKGFTEWTNVASAKPLYPGHHQPHIPADLGFYDLRVPETRAAQAEMARTYGVEAFCYYHYWFGGRRLLERPFNEVLATGQPDFPLCLCWANETWSGVWHGSPDRILIEQTYPGKRDRINHFRALLPALSDDRYLTVAGKPLFLIYAPQDLPEPIRYTDHFREMAATAGLKGLHLAGVCWRPGWNPKDFGLDAAVPIGMPGAPRVVTWQQPVKKVVHFSMRMLNFPTIYTYEEAMSMLLPHEMGRSSYPSVFPNWDNTPRSGRRGRVLHGSTPELFRLHLREAMQLVSDRVAERKLIFIKSWNEWAEGNYLEPDKRWGHAYLEVLRDEVFLDAP
jgi:lipopolysaccharide biosynthesis protein